MEKIKIKSNPYERKIEFFKYNEQSEEWVDIDISNPNSKLREIDSVRSFLPFKIKEIIDKIINDYPLINGEKLTLVFEGTEEEYEELERVCLLPAYAPDIDLQKGEMILENAKLILSEAKANFKKAQNVIIKVIKGDDETNKDLDKISDALDDIIPICVFGNYSVGKSTFINALIGYEILPSDAEPVTAKIYKITVSGSNNFARIKFRHLQEDINLIFDSKVFRIQNKNPDDVMLTELKEKMDEVGETDVLYRVNRALKFINDYEMVDKETIEIGDVIEVEVPFSKEGVLGQSRSRFVIFDTPGSNTDSYEDHLKVLREALQGFSNGIPVWVAQYENVDSSDNARLCDDVLDIKALDERFTMIIFNKADCSQLPENGFSDKQINNLLEFNSVEKMYASGIFFVSSVMGLGAKNNGKLTDKHYRKIYRSQQEMFADPEDEDYTTLSTYNIMPEQMKSEYTEFSREYAKTASDLVYVNSGLCFIEKEIEDFAYKYSAYNKCFMVYDFLKKVIDKTNSIIDEKSKSLNTDKKKRENELSEERQKLIYRLSDKAEEKNKSFYADSKTKSEEYIGELYRIYSYSVDDLKREDEEKLKENETSKDFDSYESAYMEKKNSFYDNTKKNMSKLLKFDLKDAPEGFASMLDNMASDLRELHDSKDKRNRSRTEIDKATSDEIIGKVTKEYQERVAKIWEKAYGTIKNLWDEYFKEMKESLINIIKGSEDLSPEQRELYTENLINHEPLLDDDKDKKVFEKEYYLKGQIFGFKFNSNERLDINKLSRSFNDAIKRCIKNLVNDLNDYYYNHYYINQGELRSNIEKRITEDDADLREIALDIKIKTDDINELATNKLRISDSFDKVKDLMDWKLRE